MFRVLTLEKPLTMGELRKIEQRLDEIESLFETNLPDDVHDNLCDETDFIAGYIENSLRLTEIHEKMKLRGFKIVS